MEADVHRAADSALARGDLTAATKLLEEGVAASPADYSAWMKLAALRRRSGDPPGALAAANAALDAVPNDFIALLLKGNLHEQLGDASRAAEVYRAVLFHAASQPALPPPIAQQVERARAYVADYRRGVEERLSGLADCDPAHQDRARRFAENVLDRRPVYHQEPTHYRYPGLADVEFFDDAYPGLRERLQVSTPAIQQELTALLANHAHRQQPYVDFAPGQPVGQWAELNRSAAWNALHLLRYGEADPVNAALCPATLAAFAGAEQAEVPGLGPNLMFSLLAPHTHIPPHHGVANFRVVCHLPLVVPPSCRFRVGADTREWRTGEPWIFDDTIEHEAWNDSDELRIVLIGDLWRPELDVQDRAIVCDFMQAQAGAGQPLGDL